MVRLALPFPSDAWQAFQAWPALGKLLDVAYDLRGLDAFPSPEDWQTRALGLAGFRELSLRFSLEEKPGQRARRKIPKDSLRSYESWIFDKGEIPTRAYNFHDFFNAIIWMNFPRAKHALHHRALINQNEWLNNPAFTPGKRNSLADRLTCFDEGGVVFEMMRGEDRGLIEGMMQSRDDDRKEAFVRENRDRFTLFGHGILEVLMNRLIENNEAMRLNASCLILDPGDCPVDERLFGYWNRYHSTHSDHGTLLVEWL